MAGKSKDQPEASAGPPAEAKRITPVDIQQREFRLAFRGYNERDVDVFLDEVTEEVARLYAENKRLREELEMHPTVRGDTSAAAEADMLIRRARQEAASIVAEARAQAEALQPAGGEVQRGAAAPAAASRIALGRMVAREREFLQSLAGLIQGHARALKEELAATREQERRVQGTAPSVTAASPGRPADEGAGAADRGREASELSATDRPREPWSSSFDSAASGPSGQQAGKPVAAGAPAPPTLAVSTDVADRDRSPGAMEREDPEDSRQDPAARKGYGDDRAPGEIGGGEAEATELTEPHALVDLSGGPARVALSSTESTDVADVDATAPPAGRPTGSETATARKTHHGPLGSAPEASPGFRFDNVQNEPQGRGDDDAQQERSLRELFWGED
jgi:DivIVA domain-containing protein